MTVHTQKEWDEIICTIGELETEQSKVGSYVVIATVVVSTGVNSIVVTVYSKTFEEENFYGYKKKHLSLERFRGLAISAME